MIIQQRVYAIANLTPLYDSRSRLLLELLEQDGLAKLGRWYTELEEAVDNLRETKALISYYR
jgi:hypothetical protein